MVAAQSHLVAPVDRCLFPLRLLDQLRVVLAQPASNGLVVSFVGATHGLLHTHAPRFEITPSRRRRNRDSILPLNQTCHGLPRPEVERHLQLVGHLADNQRTNPRCLPGVQPSAARASAPLARFQRAQSAFSGQPHPLAYRSQAHAEGRCRRGLRHSAMHRIHHQLSQVRLRGSIQLPGISFRFHARITHYALFGAHVSNTLDDWY